MPAPQSDRKTAGDLAEHDEEADFALGDVVGGGHVAVGEEDEKLRPPRLDLFHQRLACGVGAGARISPDSLKSPLAA